MNKKLVVGILCIIIAISSSGQSKKSGEKQLKVTYSHPSPVITKHSPGAKGIEYGFEGGRVVKINGTYHLFTSEMVQPYIWVKMRLGYWTSTDRINWTRMATIRESSGEFEGKDPRAALWSPLPVWDSKANRWNLFYVCYKAKPNTADAFYLNHEGRIMRSISKTPGLDGISGPYEDWGIVMEPGQESQSWEGLQGVDSFFPWKVGKKWYAFYGSAKTQVKPVEYWRVGMASASSLEGKWIRSENNPSEIETYDIENPIVDRLDKSRWITVYDQVSTGPFLIGYAFSTDGINWNKGDTLSIYPDREGWCKDVRTPLGVVDEGNGKYTIFYTGFADNPDWDKMLAGKSSCSLSVGFVEVEIK